jgi:glycosyltransferase involved in cell wall biosynthesis
MTVTDPPPAARTPLVSVILPTYNRAALLRQAVDSVLAQTLRDWELVVADDGSTDDTTEYLTGLADERVRWVKLGHRGSPARARAAALRIATGTWIAFLDSDDLWLPGKLEAQLCYLTANACRWSYTGYQLVDLDGAPVTRRQWGPDSTRSGWILEQLLTFGVSASMPTLMAERSLLDEVGGIDETIGIRDDYDLTLRLAAQSEVCAVPDALTLVRDHAERTTSRRRRAELFRDTARVFEKAARAGTSRTTRKLCARQRAIQLAAMGRALAEEGSRRDAVTVIARALAAAPLSGPVLRAAASSWLSLFRPINRSRATPSGLEQRR